PVVTKEYFEMSEQTKSAKIIGDSQSAIRNPQSAMFFHRMGDMGYFATQGRLWFCGRKVHRVTMKDKVLYSVCVESEFEAGLRKLMPKLSFRSALVGIGEPGSQEAVLVVENNEDVYEHCINTYDKSQGITEEP